MATVINTVLFSDIEKNPIATRKSLAYNLEAIAQSLDNLFNTEIGTRAWLPTYGTNISNIIGELMNEDTSNMILDEAINAVQLWEPRIDLDTQQSRVEPVYTDHLYRLLLVFTVSGLSSAEKFMYKADFLNE